MSTAADLPQAVTITCRAVLGVGQRCPHRVRLAARYALIPGTHPRRYERTLSGHCPAGHPVVQIREVDPPYRAGSVRAVSAGLPGHSRARR
jgi:hypothetical protein